MEPAVGDGLAALEALRRQHCNAPDRNYLKDWGDALGRYGGRNLQTVLDLAADAANLAWHIEQDPSLLGDKLVAAAILDTNPSFDFSHPPTGDALRGAISAAKGKYFEYLVADRLNHGGQVGDVILPHGFTAELADSMTQPGWDIRILDSHGHVSDYLQLKATESAAYIKLVLERYPDIKILTTEEVAHGAAQGLHVLDSSVSDHWLDQTVREAMGGAENGFAESFADAFHPLFSLVFVAATEGLQVALSRKDVTNAVASGAHRATRSLLSQGVGALVYAADGGLLSVPASLLTGMVYERLSRLYETSSLIEESRKRLLLLRLAQQERQLGGAHP